jgi:tyrosyl-tRNA synthetase
MTDAAQSAGGVLGELAWRGLINQQTNEGLGEALNQAPRTLYCGFDPSASSLHVGSLVPILALAHFRRHGHKPMALVGGATGMIGDPSGKSQERSLLDAATLSENLDGIAHQLRTILDRAMELHPETMAAGAAERAEAIPLVNNADWMSPWSFIDFLREVGVHFRVNQMLAKDSVRQRLEEREQGISYTEFSYMLIQGFDFLHLFEHHGCELQIGGSDQWGNITAGTELVRRKLGKQAYGLTLPLLLNAQGQKLGKTESGAVWLDSGRVSPYEFYQYWVRQEDADVVGLLYKLTFLPQEQIEVEVERVKSGKNKGEAQRLLAWEVTALVHGAAEADAAVRASKMLFGEAIEGLSDAQLHIIFADVPGTDLPRAELEAGISIVELLTRTGLQKSRNEARRMLTQGAIYINNRRVETGEGGDYIVTAADLATPGALVLRAGKKSYHLVRVA